jgi:Adenylate and Guanylate cyclase catalytic domain
MSFIRWMSPQPSGQNGLREIMAELADRGAAVVKRYGGTVDKFTGDGIMAVFGAPVALEDHAIRACLAALGIQDETARLAAEVKDRDGVDLQLRVGLNSGEVIAGEIGSGPFGYTAVGEQVGMAQRMESVAHALVLRGAIEAHGGWVFKHTDDGWPLRNAGDVVDGLRSIECRCGSGPEPVPEPLIGRPARMAPGSARHQAFRA